MMQVEKARQLLRESLEAKRAGKTDAAFAKLWSAVDWLCDALEAKESGTYAQAEKRSVAPGAR